MLRRPSDSSKACCLEKRNSDLSPIWRRKAFCDGSSVLGGFMAEGADDADRIAVTPCGWACPDYFNAFCWLVMARRAALSWSQFTVSASATLASIVLCQYCSYGHLRFP